MDERAAARPGAIASPARIRRAAAGSRNRRTAEARPSTGRRAIARRPGKIITGKLVAHGRASYQFEAGGSPSYYVKVLSTRGLETQWGVDLERAIKRSKTQPKIGSMIGARRMGSELVTLGASGAARPDAARRTARRAQWIFESIAFFAEALRRSRREREAQLADARTLREHPELRSAFISLHVAEKFAERNIRDPRDRALFMERVKEVMALSLKGEAVYESRPPRNPSPERDPPAR